MRGAGPLRMRPAVSYVRTVARAEPAAVFAALIAHRLTLRDAAQVRADADQNDPVLMVLLGAVRVGRRFIGRQVVVARQTGREDFSRRRS